MANSDRNVKLSLQVEALGTDNIKKLETALRDLGKEGGSNASEFSKLADEVARLGQQDQALQTVKGLAAEVSALEQAQQGAAQRVQEATAAFKAFATVTEAARSAQAAAKQELLEGQKAQAEATAALRTLRAEYDATGKNTTEYRNKLQQATEIQNAANIALVQLRANVADSNKAMSEAAGAQQKANNELTKATAAYTAANTAMAAHNNALNEAGRAAKQVGLDISDLAAAEKDLQGGLLGVVSSAKNRRDAILEMAEADRLAAIEAKGMVELYRNGEVALQAEIAAQKEAAKAIDAYAAAKAKALEDEQAWQREAEGIVEAAHAAQRLAAAQKELADQRAFAQMADDAQRMVKAAQYVRDFEDALEEAERQAAETAAQAARIEGAFQNLGIRSVREVSAEIKSVNDDLAMLTSTGQLTGRELTSAMNAAATRTQALEREIRELTGSLTLADRAADLFSNSMGQIAAGNLIADGIGSLIERVKEMGREFITANQEMDRLQRTMTQLQGSSQAAAQQIDFLRKVADIAGVSVSSITDSFIRFQASATASGMALSEVNAVFQAVTVNGSKMGMSADRVSLALDALGQMASKGVVSMEELRQQLGDSLPGATAIAAKGLGLTVSELTKIVESGQLLAEDFFPAFRRGLEETFGDADKPVEGLWQSIARLGNEFTKLYQRATNSEAFKVLGQTIDVVANNFEALVSTVSGLGKAFLALKVVEYARSLGQVGAAASKATVDVAAQTVATAANTTATAANTVVTQANAAAATANAAATNAQRTATTGLAGVITPATQAISRDTAATVANTAAKNANTIASRAQAAASSAVSAGAAVVVGSMGRVVGVLTGAAAAARGLFAALGGLPGALLLVAMNAKELGTWLGESVAKMGEAGRVAREVERQNAEYAQKEKERAAQREADAAKRLQAMQREVAGMVEVRNQLEGQEAASKKATEAAAIRANVIERTAALYGQEAEALAAAAQATETNLAATTKERDARAAVVTALEQEIAKREALLAAASGNNEKAKEELEVLRKSLGVRKEELDGIQNTVDLLRVQSTERKIASEVLKDNSARTSEYAAAMISAKTTLAELQAMERQGLPVKEALAKAESDLALQTRLYADAIKDSVSLIQAKNQLEQSNLETKRAGFTVRQAELDQMIAAAKATGDSAEATRLEIEAKKIQIEVVRLNAEAKRLEAIASREAAEAELRGLETSGQITEAKRLELQARIANARAKEIEAGASDAIVRGLRDELVALQNGTAAREDSAKAIDNETSAISANTSERERSIAAREKEIELAEREDELYRNRWQMDKNNRSVDSDGNVIQMAAPSSGYVIDTAEAQGLTKAQIKALIEKHLPGGRATRSGPAWFSAVNEEIARMRVENLSMEDVGSSSTTPPVQSDGAANSPAASGTNRPAANNNLMGGGRTVVINIGNRARSVNVASDRDGDTLVSVLRDLETAANRSS